MRLLLITFLGLGLLVMLFGIAEQSFQFSRWSSLVTSAEETGVLQNEKFSQRLNQFSDSPDSPFSFGIIGTGLVICVLAICRLVKETRPKEPPI